MLYIHKPTDLSRKAAEVESVYLIREAKQKGGLPFSTQKLETAFSPYLLVESDLEVMKETYNRVTFLIDRIKELLEQGDSLHESVNLHRTLQILRKIPLNLINNLKFSQEIISWQKEFLAEASLVLNSVPRLRTKEEKIGVNQKISQWFEKILRSPQFFFNDQDLINEGHKVNLRELSESLSKGFFFHVSLEEELKKSGFSVIRGRLPATRLQEAEEIEQEVLWVKEGVDKIYEANLRLVHFAVILYAYVKWANMSV